MQKYRKNPTPPKEMPDLSETKAHIFLAGHELLRAAEGVLKYCKSYVEETGEKRSHPNLMKVFSSAMVIAKDLAASMLKESPLKGHTEKITRHFCNTIEKEIREEKSRVEQEAPKTTKRRKRK